MRGGRLSEKKVERCRIPGGKVNSTNTIYSMEWFPDNPNILMTGSDNWMKVFDIRRSENEIYRIDSSCIQGIQFNKSNNRIILSYSEDSIKIWDRAKIKNPLHVIKDETHSISSAQWANSNTNLIASHNTGQVFHPII